MIDIEKENNKTRGLLSGNFSEEETPEASSQLASSVSLVLSVAGTGFDFARPPGSAMDSGVLLKPFHRSRMSAIFVAYRRRCYTVATWKTPGIDRWGSLRLDSSVKDQQWGYCSPVFPVALYYSVKLH